MLTVDNVTKRYKSGGQEVYALNGVSLTVERGEFLAVIGKSGCGKSTLLHIISGLASPTSGAVLYEGEDITARNRESILRFRAEHVGIILQNFSLLNDRTVYANVELPLKIHKVEKTKREKLVREYLGRMDMLEYIDRYPNQLSGGQQQRAAIARALVCDADILLADEPTGSLDSENAMQIIDILRSIADSGKTVVMVTHDMEAAAKCDRCIRLDRGEVVPEGRSSGRKGIPV